jgi:long-chain acyl-CoA synthetase
MIHPIDSLRRWWKHAPNEADPLPPGGDNGHSNGGNGKANGKPAAPVVLDPPWLAHLDRADIPRSLSYPSTTIGRILDQSADRFGDATAVVYGATRWTYSELLAQVNRTAGGLASLGVRRGDRVLLALPNCPEMVTTFLAVQKLAAVVVNVGPLMGADDLTTVMTLTAPRVAVGLDLQSPLLGRAGRDSSVEHWVWVSLQAYQPVLKRLGYQYKLWQGRNGHGEQAQHVALADMLAQAPARPPTVEPDPARVAVLQATGGTTGTLKLAQLSHRGLLANVTQMSAWMNCRSGQERFLAVLPMFHVFGLTTCLLTPVFNASSMILMTRFAAREALDLVRRERATVFPLVPAICAGLCDELERQEKKDQCKPPPLDSVRLCVSGAAPLPAPAMERFARMAGAPVIEGYGLTEASPVTHVNLLGKPRAGSIGLPMPDTRVRVVKFDSSPDRPEDVAPGEPGEMLISGPQVMLGYFANPEQTRHALLTDAAGVVWLRTGDVVRMDEEGFFYVLDRKKDMIIRAGLKVFPAKVEGVLLRHPRVSDVAVVGRADDVKTESVVAVVVAKPRPAPADKSAAVPTPEDDRAQLSDELRLLCREHLAPYEVPQQFEFVTELPRSPLGKLLKRELRKAKTGAAPAISLPEVVEHAEQAPALAPLAKASPGGNGSTNGNGKHSPGGNGSHSTGAWRNGADKKEAM